MRRVYVLGAGASRFAGFPLGGELLPFLRSEYNSNSRDKMIRDLCGYALSFIEKVKPFLPAAYILPTGEPDLEFVLSLADRDQNDLNKPDQQLIQDLDALAKQLALDAWDLLKVRKGFTTLVASAFLYKSRQLLEKDNAPPQDDFSTVSAAWTKQLNPGDTLISFNWDLLQEALLSKAKKWSTKNGYGIPPEKPLPSASVTILKLHGSCNWALSHGDDLSLRLDHTDTFFGIQKQGLQYPNPPGCTSYYGDSLIIPSYLKDPLRIKILRPVWESATAVLREAESLVILGYSLPRADISAQRLFGDMVRSNTTLKSITLVLGDDEESFNRWDSVFGDYRNICQKVRQKFEKFITC